MKYVELLRKSLTLVLLSVAMSPAAAADVLKMTVIGGGGTLGQRIVNEALNRGHRVTVVARDPTKVTREHERLKVVRGDVLDSAHVRALAEGQDVLISAIGSARAATPDPEIYRKAAESLVGALRRLGDRAPRLLVVGGAGSLLNPSGKMLLDIPPPPRRPEHEGQLNALDYYRTVSDVKWSYFSPAASITPGTRTGMFRLGEDRVVIDDKNQSQISMEDYAMAMIDEAEQPRHVRRRFTIGY